MSDEHLLKQLAFYKKHVDKWHDMMLETGAHLPREKCDELIDKMNEGKKVWKEYFDELHLRHGKKALPMWVEYLETTTNPSVKEPVKAKKK